METAEKTESKKAHDDVSHEAIQPERPFIDNLPGGLRLRWQYTDIEFAADIVRITDKATAEVTFFYSAPESDRETLLLATNRLDCLSSTQKYNLIRQLREIGYTKDFIQFIDWERKVNDIALAVLQNCRSDQPTVEVRADPGITLTPDYLLAPVLYKNHPNIIFGEYGSLKSFVALMIAYIVQLPHPNNKLGFIPGSKAAFCLYLDYEDEQSSFTRRWTALQRGFRPGDDLELTIFYRRMKASLAESVESLRQDITENHIELLIVDSLGPAARGNLNDPEPAIQYHQALRALGGVTSLTLAHTSKDPLTKKRTIFGSIFFTNLARSIWECKAEVQPEEDEAIISLKQVKANLSKFHPAIGCKFNFDNDKNIITIAEADLGDTELSSELSTRSLIKTELLRNGAMSLTELKARLPDRKATTVERELRRLQGKYKEVIHLENDTWALAS
ncbi:MAG: AAA family ATPase [Chloroflexota bacterium]|nr:MAG: AAA family ATPase [Chloroflexota bacterium]